MPADQLVIVSLYEPRSRTPLVALLDSLESFDPGCGYDLAVAVNRTGTGPLLLPRKTGNLRIIERPNEGMNIGAWDHAWRECGGYRGYLFLQDECQAQAAGWLSAFRDAALDERVGLVGESWNAGWDRPWMEMRRAVAAQQMREHWIGGQPANRVDVYQSFMQAHGVDPGERAGHLRSLVWYARREVLERMGGFLHGANYGECIAAEIAATKRAEQLGWKAMQVDARPFSRFRHLEWKEVEPGRWKHTPAGAAQVRHGFLTHIRSRLGL